ncbi:hypothetical protein Hdeb2414_s0018g00519731 [Helianthus debilis subsp. tardiflorus]
MFFRYVNGASRLMAYFAFINERCLLSGCPTFSIYFGCMSQNPLLCLLGFGKSALRQSNLPSHERLLTLGLIPYILLVVWKPSNVFHIPCCELTRTRNGLLLDLLVVRLTFIG